MNLTVSKSFFSATFLLDLSSPVFSSSFFEKLFQFVDKRIHFLNKLADVPHLLAL